jgi:outer membrane protein assembly factor BamB
MKNARTWCVWLAIVATLTLWVSCRKESGALPVYNKSEPFYDNLPVELDWTQPIVSERTIRSIPKILACRNGIVYLELNRQEIMAVDLVSRKEKWVVQLDTLNGSFSLNLDVEFINDDILLYDYRKIVRLKAETGQVLYDHNSRDFMPSGRFPSNAVFSRGHVYFVVGTINNPSQIQVWQFDPDSKSTSMLWMSDEIWHLASETPMVADEAKQQLHFVCAVRDSESLQFSHFMVNLNLSSGSFSTVPFVAPNYGFSDMFGNYFKNGNYIIGDFGKANRVRGLNIGTGQFDWEIDGRYWKFYKDRLYTSGFELGKVNPTTGLIDWVLKSRISDFDRIAFHPDKPLLFGAFENKFELRDLTDGQLLAESDISTLIPQGGIFDRVVFDTLTNRVIVLSSTSDLTEVSLSAIRFPL